MSLAGDRAFVFGENSFIVYDDLDFSVNDSTHSNDHCHSLKSMVSNTDTKLELNMLMEEATTEFLQFEPSLKDIIPMENVEFENYRDNLLSEEMFLDCELKKSISQQPYDKLPELIGENEKMEKIPGPDDSNFIDFNSITSAGRLIVNDGYSYDLSYLNVGSIIKEKLQIFMEKNSHLNIGHFTAIASDEKYYLYIGTNTGKIIVIYYQYNKKITDELDVRNIKLLYDPNYNNCVNMISIRCASPCDKSSSNSDSVSVSHVNNDQSMHEISPTLSLSDNLPPSDSITIGSTNSSYKMSNLLHKNIKKRVENHRYLFVLYENDRVVIWDIKLGKIITKMHKKDETTNPTINQIVMYDKYSLYITESNGNGYYVKFSQNYKHYRKTLIYTSNLSHSRVFPLYFHSKYLKKLQADPCILAVATSTNVFVVGLNQVKRNIYTTNLIKLYSETHNIRIDSSKLMCMEMKWYISNLSHIILACVSTVAIFFVSFEYAGEFTFKEITIFPASNTTCFEWIDSETFFRIDNNEDLTIVHFNGCWSEEKIRSLSTLKLSQSFLYSAFGCGYMNVMTRVTRENFVILGSHELLDFSTNNDIRRLEFFARKNHQLKALLMIKHCYQKLNSNKNQIETSREELFYYSSVCLEKYLHDSLNHMRFISNGSPFYDQFLRILWTIAMYFCTLKELKSIWYLFHMPPKNNINILASFTLLMSTVYQEFLVDFTEKRSLLDVVLDHVIEKKKIDHVPSLLFNDMKNYLMVTNQISLFEKFILNLNEFNVEQDDPIFTTLINSSLYGPYLYMFNQGLHEYCEPLLTLASIIIDQRLTDATHSHKINSILDALTTNINQNLTALSNRMNDINVKRMEDTFNFLLYKRLNVDSRRTQFDILKLLLDNRLTIFLDIMAVAFAQSKEVIGDSNYNTLILKKNELINAIANVMMSHDEFGSNDKSLFYLFLAREIVHNPNTVSVNKAIFNRLFDYLTITNLDRSADKQSILYALFERNYFVDFTSIATLPSNLSNTSIMKNKDKKLVENIDDLTDSSNFYSMPVIVKILKKCHYYHVIALVYEKSHQYEELIKLYLFMHESRLENDFNIFDQMKSVFLSVSTSNNTQMEAYQKAIILNLRKLIDMDLNTMLLFVVDFVPSMLDYTVQLCKEDSSIYYNILEALFIQIEETRFGVIADVLQDVFTLQLNFIGLACIQHTENFLLQYLRHHKIYTSYEKLIPLFKKHNFQSCLIQVYSQMEDFSSVSLIYKNLLISEFAKLKVVANQLLSNEDCSQWTTLIVAVSELFDQFFEFFSTKFHLFENEFSWNLWRDILENCLSLLNVNSTLLSDIGDLCKRIFENMTQYVSIFLVLQRILQKQSLYRTIIPKLSIMFTNLTQQKSLNRTRYQLANTIASSEVITWSRRFFQASKKAFSCRSEFCNLCNHTMDHYLTAHNAEGITTTVKHLNNYILVFECGHWEHKVCFSRHYGNQNLNNNNNNKINCCCSKCFCSQLSTLSYRVVGQSPSATGESTIFVDNIVQPVTHSRGNSWMAGFDSEFDQLQKKHRSIYENFENFLE